MTELIAAVRSTGSRTPVLAAGIYRAELLTGWLAHRPPATLGFAVAWSGSPGALGGSGQRAEAVRNCRSGRSAAGIVGSATVPSQRLPLCSTSRS